MTTHVEVAGALSSAGYLSDADVDAAIAVLTDALIVAATEAAARETSTRVDAAEE